MLAVVSLRKPKVINVNLSDMAPGTRTINKLDIAIVGGGLGGLTAAICLIKSGHNVRVFEQASALTEVGAGIQISANASRVLLSLGLKEKLDAVASLPTRDEALAKLLATFKEPVSKFVKTVNEVPSKFVRTLAAIKDAK